MILLRQALPIVNGVPDLLYHYGDPSGCPHSPSSDNKPMATCTGHFTAGGSIKFRDNRWVWVHNNRRRLTCHLTAGKAIKLIVNRRMGIHNCQRRHTFNRLFLGRGAIKIMIENWFASSESSRTTGLTVHATKVPNP
ncbi:hypothetical protein TNCV_4321881 [Trichonephila clavipes]|uniref:Uncharacterized protein n=1 Tax=Trichonephila clavipes TaxID=2585209 RepID=A0A8X6S9S6_TRICX|nr:hypothetical protein TNCV_4321881 [Trichonephila clavipes]